MGDYDAECIAIVIRFAVATLSFLLVGRVLWNLGSLLTRVGRK